MKNIDTIIKKFEGLPTAFVDAGWCQGRNKILNNMEDRFGKNQELYVDDFLVEMQTRILNLIKSAKPWEVDADYIYFLNQYGGITISNDYYYFATLGMGPFVEDRYSSIDSDEAIPNVTKHGFLSIGSLSFRKGKHKYQIIEFFLDLAGTIQKDSVIYVGPMENSHHEIVQELQSYPHAWQKVADSFTEWLDMVVKTEGTFGYV